MGSRQRISEGNTVLFIFVSDFFLCPTLFYYTFGNILLLSANFSKCFTGLIIFIDTYPSSLQLQCMRGVLTLYVMSP